MQFRVFSVFAALFFMIPVTSLAAQEKSPADSDAAPAGPKAAPPTEPGPQRAEFERVFTEWKDVLAELATLQVRYRKADPPEKAEIEKQWDQVIAQGDALEPQLINAAEKAYAEAANADKNLAALLVDVLVGEVVSREFAMQTDNYEQALRIGRLLMENQCEEKPVADAAGIAAFVMADFDAAQMYLNLAKQQKTISQLGEHYLMSIPECKKAWEKEKQIRQAEAKADDLPRVLLKTSQGDIELELFENEAPNTVANFISLVKKGFYDGLTFHRVLPGFMAQAGCPKGDGKGGPGYNIPCECYQPNYRKHFRGSLSMAKGEERDTGGSQFFLTFVPTTFLDGIHTVFGRVIKGFDVLHKIQRRDPEKLGQPKPDTIIEAKVIRDRSHPYAPKKVGQ